MEKRYLVTIQRLSDGKESKSIMEYIGDEAYHKFYEEMTYATNPSNTTIVSCICIVLNNVGKTIKYDMYIKPVMPPEPVEETEE